MVKGRYGEFKILVDGQVIIDGGAKAIMGILPSARSIVADVRARLSE